MNLSESAQELLELLWIATEEKNEAGLTFESESPEGIEELVHLGLAEWSGEQPPGPRRRRHRGGRHTAAEWASGQLRLTAAGQPEAAMAVRRHRLAERLLVDVLGTEEALDEHACRFEHALVDGVDETICTLLGHPRLCPHGKPIPPGACCERMQESVERLIAPLCDLQPGQRGHIAYIQMNDPKRLQKLMAMGVLPGVPIALLRRFPSYVFEAGYSQFAVDKEIAADINVRLEQ